MPRQASDMNASTHAAGHLLAAIDAGGSSLLLDLLAILAAAAVVTYILGRLRIATIPGYLITGAIIGPYALGMVADAGSVEAIAHLALILLMFGIGLHMDLAAGRGGMVPALSIGVVSTLAAALVGWPIALLIGLSVPAALTVAVAMAISSTAVVLRVLQQRRGLLAPKGRLCFAVLVVQDLIAVSVLALLPLLQAWHAASAGQGVAAPGDQTGLFWDTPPGLFVVGLLRLAGIAALVLGGKLFLPRLLEQAARAGSNELMLVVSAAVALGAAVLADALGLSPELGAFMAGFILAATPFRHEVAGQLAPMRDLFMAVFFTAIGMRLELRETLDAWWVIALASLAIVVLKPLLIGVSAWAFGASAALAAAVGLALAQTGEFSLIILDAAARGGLISETVLAGGIATVVVTLIVTPALMDLGCWVGSRLDNLPLAPWVRQSVRQSIARDATDAGTPPSGPTHGHVIIAGFGPVGRTLADRFEQAGISFTIIDLNPVTVRNQSRLGQSIVYGDVNNRAVLESAGIRHADAVILTIPDQEATLRACRAIRGVRPGVFIAARTKFLSKAFQATELGANHVTVEEIATAEAMERQVAALLAERASAARSCGSPTP